MWQNLPTFSGEGGQDITITFIDLVEAFVKLQHWFCKKLEMTTPAQIKVTCTLIYYYSSTFKFLLVLFYEVTENNRFLYTEFKTEITGTYPYLLNGDEI